ncbi:MAG TPA: hypothetical protein PLA71_00535 [Saccharofermentans sp.]|nr:hypothetical protein [Saccharofermentans sp.]
MKIISDFKDYYDGTVDFTDNRLTYLRKSEETDLILDQKKRYNGIDLELIHQFLGRTSNSNGHDKHYVAKDGSIHDVDKDEEGFFLGFCGKLYPVIKVHAKNYILRNVFEETRHIYDHEEILDEIKDGFFYSGYKTRIMEMFSKLSEVPATKLFQEFDTPVFLLARKNIRISKANNRYSNSCVRFITNPCLKDFEFYRMVNPYQASQEIDMYLGNNLAKEKEVAVPVGGDKVLAASKGYDKYSFRKDKAK